jgi:hypothetical protein
MAKSLVNTRIKALAREARLGAFVREARAIAAARMSSPEAARLKQAFVERGDRLEGVRAEVLKGVELSKDGAEQRRFRMVAYSGATIGRYWGRLAIDLKGIACDSRLAILFEHNDEKPVGVCDKHALTDEGLVLEGYFLQGNEDADKITAAADQGFPWKCSIGVRDFVLEEVLEGAKSECNGEEIDGPVTIARKSRLFETSWITCNPADLATTGEVVSG